MAFSYILEGLQCTLGSNFDHLLQDPSPLQELDFDFLDVDPPVDSAPTGMHDIQVVPESDFFDLDSLVASVASSDMSSNSPQPSEASGLMDLDEAASHLSSSPLVSTPSPSDPLSRALHVALSTEDFQSSLSESQSTSCSSGPSVAVPETIPRPFVYTVTILDPDLAVSKETANFQVHIDRGRASKKTGRMVKGQDWTFSEDLNRLYVNKDKICPVSFVTSIPAQFRGHYRVRAHVSYLELQHVNERVRRCLSDVRVSDPESEPLMGCPQPGARAETYDRHHMVLVPLDVTTDGFLSRVAGYTFSCLSTCQVFKDLKVRVMKLTFRLETVYGQKVDEKSVELNLCRCPGRSIEDEEKKYLK
jgi:P53 DNA-binding domain